MAVKHALFFDEDEVFSYYVDTCHITLTIYCTVQRITWWANSNPNFICIPYLVCILY